MEALEKIYLNPIQDVLTKLLSTKVKGGIEYIRKDAFIEKACNAYCKVCGHYPHTVPTHICRNNCDYFSDFKMYMEEL